MKEENLRVQFTTGYANTVKAIVWINDVEHILELQHLQELLEKQITEKGYTISQSKRQKYPRLTINE